MKKINVFLLLNIINFILVFAKQDKPKIKLVDKIVSRVNGVNVLRSDLKKIRISKNGRPFTLQEAMIDELLFQKSIQRKMLPTELDVEKQIVSFYLDRCIFGRHSGIWFISLAGDLDNQPDCF